MGPIEQVVPGVDRPYIYIDTIILVLREKLTDHLANLQANHNFYQGHHDFHYQHRHVV